MLKKLLMIAAGTAFITLGVGEASQAATFNVLASGLNSPRGLNIGSDGALYVTEAGTGGTEPCIPSPEGGTICYGATGAVTRIQNGIQQRVVTGLPSIASANGNGATGAQDIAFDAIGKPYVVMGLGANPSQRDILGVPDFGQLLAINDLNAGASWTRVADLAGYEALNNPDGTNVDSNPYSLLIQGNTAFVVDAGANDLLRVGLDGSNLAVQSVFPERSVPNPFGGPDISMQSVPNAIASGSDGALYVGELTGFPFPQGGARVYRIDSNNQPQVYADGFTNIIDIAFDNQDSLYVLEYATNSILSGDPTGALIRVAADGTRTTIASEGLISPTGLALGSNGEIYVSNRGFNAGEGQVLQISVPESTSNLSLLAFGAVGAGSLLLQKQKSARS
ncbi:MAG TPA: ScyD/ScyE family protein [Candidatus Obscuribacterales bacterium]